LAPHCSRIEMASIPKKRDEERLLHSMGFETANIHLGSKQAVKMYVATSPNTRPGGFMRRPKRWGRGAKDWKNGVRVSNQPAGAHVAGRSSPIFCDDGSPGKTADLNPVLTSPRQGIYNPPDPCERRAASCPEYQSGRRACRCVFAIQRNGHLAFQDDMAETSGC